MAKDTQTLKNFAERMNPLRGLTKNQVDYLLDNARRGNDANLQVAFSLVEQTMPIFGVCIQKRIAGIQQRRWAIQPLNESEQAKAQAEIVQKIFQKSDAKNIDGLTEAIRTLSLAAFRGRGVVKPFIDGNGLRFKVIQNWNALESNNKLYWNPNPEEFRCGVDGLQQIPEGEVCWVKDALPIDIPGLQIYLRQLVGEETWARAVEKYGVAQIIVTTPEGTPDSSMDEWSARALRIMEGGSGSVPFGSQVQQLNGARGQDPFSEYIDHQMAMISILATGGTLATIGGSSGLGSNTAEIQNTQFQSLVTNDCKRISNALTECAVAKVCDFLGQEQLCRFTYVEDEDITPQQYIEMARAMKELGATIDLAKLKDLTKLDFISIDAKKDEAQVWQPDAEQKEGE